MPIASAVAAKTFKIPKTHAECADMAYKLRQERYALQKKVDEMKSQEAELVEHLIDNLPKTQALGIVGKVARATIVEKEIVDLQGDGKDKFAGVYDYILKNARKNPGVWSLLQRRVGDEAAKEIIAAGKGKLIGAKLGIVKSISLTKL
jgi:hypothetical protein